MDVGGIAKEKKVVEDVKERCGAWLLLLKFET